MSVANQNVAGQTGDNVVIGGATYTIGTDWGSGGGTGFTGAHVQVVKTAWGDTDYTYRTSKLKPLPVQIFDGVQGSTGALIDSGSNALKITGGVRFSEKIGISGGQLDGHNRPTVSGIVQIVGPTFGPSGPTAYAAGHIAAGQFNPVKVTGAIAGYANAYPVGVTFTEGKIRYLDGGTAGYTGHRWGYTSLDTVAIQGISGGHSVGITAHDTNGLNIRNLSSGTTYGSGWIRDSIAVEGFAGATAIGITGEVMISNMPSGGSFEIRSIQAGRDNIAVWGADGSTAAHVKLLSGNGTPIGASAVALKVAIDNGNFTSTVTVNPAVFVKSATGTSGHLVVRGITNEYVTVQGPLASGALEVSSTSGLNIRSLTTTDKVSVGGDIADDVSTIKSALSTIQTKLNTIDTTVATLGGNIVDVENIVTNFQNNGTEKYTDPTTGTTGIVFNTQVKETKQPTTLISIVTSVGSKAKVLSTNVDVHNGVYIQSHPSNSSNVMIGGASMLSNTSLGHVLEPGDSVFLQVSNLNAIYGKSISGNSNISILGS